MHSKSQMDGLLWKKALNLKNIKNIGEHKMCVLGQREVII